MIIPSPIPLCPELPINLLAASFNNTSASYKFYWLLSLIEELESGNTTISKQQLFAGMVSTAWYTVNYYHVSFGKQDQLQRAVHQLREIEKIMIDEKRVSVKNKLLLSTNPATIKILMYFDKEVPHRFLSPWFSEMKGNRAEIYKRSMSFERCCPYALDEENIIVNPFWQDYFVKQAGILKAFCYWMLSLYLQKHNPNVPDIPNKLIKPAKRNSLSNQRRFWTMVIDEYGPLDCIYTGKKLEANGFAVEHFVPYAFVSHDLIWNLIPADPEFNSKKNDRLPRMEKYFEQFYQLQRTAIEIMLEKYSDEVLLTDYLTILPNLENQRILSEFDKQKFRESIQPLLTIASNNGFEYLV